jgi:hypothetical protein
MVKCALGIRRYGSTVVPQNMSSIIQLRWRAPVFVVFVDNVDEH